MLLGSAMYSTAQTNISTRTEVIPCSDFHITRPLRELFANNPVEEEVPRKPEESADKKYRKSHDFKFSVADGPQYGNDPEIIQRKEAVDPPKPRSQTGSGKTRPDSDPTIRAEPRVRIIMYR
ncbi:MAG: hypothetical protein HWD58_08400 [Bacteroidota bacterium]|nr:MAG: hypothetical protein HWD58_08400 [Bacteroidota bacterium]